MRKAALALLLSLLPSAVAAQVAPATLPPSTVWGRLGISAGPGQAIPFSVLSTNVLTGLCATAGALPVYNATTGAWACSTANFSSLADGASWALSLARMGLQSSTAANAFTLNAQLVIPLFNGGVNYEKAAVAGNCLTYDDSPSNNYDCVGGDFHATIAATISTGRAFGLGASAVITAGGDGYLVGFEADVYNNGVSQSSVDTTTTKTAIQAIAYGTNPTTVAFQARTGTSTFHKVLYSTPTDIASGGKFLELFGKFTVDALGKTIITNSTATSGFLGITVTGTQTQPNTSDTNDGAVLATWTLTAASASNELVSRVFKLSTTNNLTGGGAISNLRIFNLTANYNASTTTTNSYGIYMEAGTVTGTVTTSYGLYFENNWTQGTTKWAIYDAAQLASYLGGLSLGTTTQAAAGSLLATGTVTAGGHFISSAATKTLQLKQGANGAVGTFICTSGGTITITNSNVAVSDAIIISLNTVGGTISTAPAVNAITAATSFTTKCATNDTSTYNYAIIKNAA